MTGTLLYAALASALGAISVALIAPIEAHVVPFLAVLSGWTFASWSLWQHLARSPKLGGDERARAVLVLVIAASLRLPFVLLPPTPSTDAYRYSWEGRVANAGMSPYRFPPSSPALAFLKRPQDARINNPSLSTIYPPLALAAFRLAALASPDPRAQKGLFAFCDLAVCALLMRLLRRRGLTSAWAAVYAWHPLVVVEFSAAGHLDPLMILGILIGVDFWESGGFRRSVVAWSAATLVKILPILVLPWLLLRRPRLAVLFAAITVIGLIPALPGLAAAIRGTRESGIAAFALGWIANPSLYAVLSPVIESSFGRRAVLSILLAVTSVVWARKCGDDVARYLCGMTFAVLLSSPVVQPWYVLWTLPLALLTPFPAAIAWSWIVGFMYFAIDPALKSSSARLPWWHWVWIGEYALVFGLLARSLMDSRQIPAIAPADERMKC